MARTLGQNNRSIQTRAHPDEARQLGMAMLATVGIRIQNADRTEVPEYGHIGNAKDRDRVLRDVWTLPGATIIQAAISAIIQKVQSTSYNIEGAIKSGRRVNEMLHNSDFGAGWEVFLSKIITDYLTQDNGFFVEILGEGAKDSELEGAALGLAHLDSFRCYRTGNLKYPVIYVDEDGKRHKLHWTRVFYQSDLPSTSEERLDVGFCALSRCIKEVQATVKMAEMRNEMLTDAPASGVMVANGINPQSWDDRMKAYEAERATKNQNMYRPMLELLNPNAANKVSVEFIPFRQLWENFKEREFMDIMIDLVAMAFNLDRQELAPLSTSALGSGAQSTVLNQKSRGKGVGNIISMIERMINKFLPMSLEFHFDFQDDEQDRQKAEIRHLKTSTILSLYTAQQKQSNMQYDAVQVQEPLMSQDSTGILSREETRYLLVREGVIPRELLTEDEMINPDWEQFDDVTQKAFEERRYGKRAIITKERKVRNIVPEWQALRKSTAMQYLGGVI